MHIFVGEERERERKKRQRKRKNKKKRNKKKWPLLGIRIHFPFQWMNFGWLRLCYECADFVFLLLRNIVFFVVVAFCLFSSLNLLFWISDGKLFQSTYMYIFCNFVSLLRAFSIAFSPEQKKEREPNTTRKKIFISFIPLVGRMNKTSNNKTKLTSLLSPSLFRMLCDD